ncbi:MAG: Rieske 2Fe-2S domain-containing protein [Bacteroidota bacterium]|nr:Rieske 2Fe-2S domain-containing protein [Bacteroidota bacterium]MDP4235794.1 Rieske 2Fe-2S domain-containing protein [Bacteroidota bacterium]
MSSRRDFLKICMQGLSGIAVLGFVAPVINGCSGNATDPGSNVAAFNITVDVSSLTANNTAIRTTTPDGNSLLVVRQSSTTYITLLLICTHQGCGGPDMRQIGSVINCSCHGSQFDLAGRVIQGPATTNLTTYPTAFDATAKKVTIHN